MSKVGIVILNYNDSKTTINMINKIKDYKNINHILIVDNNSSDDSVKNIYEVLDKKIEILELKDNLGYAHGNNEGIKYLQDNYKLDYIIISNPDINVKESTIGKMIDVLDEHKSVSLIAPYLDERGVISRGWKLPTYFDSLTTITNTKQRFHKKLGKYDDEHYKEELTEVDVVSGEFFMIRSDVIKDVDYFDEGTFLYYEENILGTKLKKRDYKTYILTSETAIHELSVSVDKSIKKIRKYKMLVKSLMYFEKKFKHTNIFGMMFLYIAYFFSLIGAYIVNIFKR